MTPLERARIHEAGYAVVGDVWTPGERRLIALHEAGHAVAYHVLGLGLEYASNRPGRTFAGVAVAASPAVTAGFAELTEVGIAGQPVALRANVERRIIGKFAGELAALTLVDRTGHYQADNEWSELARDALVALGPRIAELVTEHEEQV